MSSSWWSSGKKVEAKNEEENCGSRYEEQITVNVLFINQPDLILLQYQSCRSVWSGRCAPCRSE